ncbi:MAG: hypothetical protein AAGA76_16525, partial [Pseudomonadota bacterium]
MANKSSSPKLKYLDTKKVLGIPEEKEASAWLISAVENLIGIRRYNELVEDLGPDWPDANTMITHMFDRLNIRWDVQNSEILETLDDKPKVFVANHPYGLPDAFALFD